MYAVRIRIRRIRTRTKKNYVCKNNKTEIILQIKINSKFYILKLCNIVLVTQANKLFFVSVI